MFAPSSKVCYDQGRNQVHLFDLVKSTDLVACKCRCGNKMSGFPSAGTGETRTVKYTITHQIR